MSTDDHRTDVSRPSWADAVDRLEAIDPTILAFHPEPDVRGRLARQSLPEGPLHGLPLGVKDLYRVDGLPTTAGSALPPELFDGEQSWVVSLLRDAGAFVLGKTAMDEFGFSEQPPTRNPRDLSRTPDGSSSGSAAAVAAGICSVALGSQSLHSTIGPAAYCGVVGYKPSYDRWPFDGVPMSPSFDTLGILGVDVQAVTEVASVLPGWDSDPVRRPVLGVPHVWGKIKLHTEGWTAFARHVRALRTAGYEVRSSEVPWNEDIFGWSSVITDLVLAEMADVHRDWFGRYRELYRPMTVQAIERGLTVASSRLAECKERRRAFIDELEAATASMEIDCWICPSSGSVAPPLEGSGRDTWLTRFWSFSGWPLASVPLFDGEGGLPLGVQLAAPLGRDEELLQWAAEIHGTLLGMEPRPSDSR